MDAYIVIPARYGSVRLPAKPLASIAGVVLIERMVALAKIASAASGAAVLVATDHPEILERAKSLGVDAVMTPSDVPTGSDRCLAAIDAVGGTPNIVVNLQGDAPFTPPQHLSSLVQAARSSSADILTAGTALSWDQLEKLREQKRTTPFSGTTCIRDQNGKALWFSKSIIPAIRNEKTQATNSPMSPVIRHVGVYAYKVGALRKYVALEPSPYEILEGLEQLRALENNMRIDIELVLPPRISMSGIDTPEDVLRAEKLISANGDPFHTGSYI